VKISKNACCAADKAQIIPEKRFYFISAKGKPEFS